MFILFKKIINKSSLSYIPGGSASRFSEITDVYIYKPWPFVLKDLAHASLIIFWGHFPFSEKQEECFMRSGYDLQDLLDLSRLFQLLQGSRYGIEW